MMSTVALVTLPARFVYKCARSPSVNSPVPAPALPPVRLTVNNLSTAADVTPSIWSNPDSKSPPEYLNKLHLIW